jgi:hypothetical protein
MATTWTQTDIDTLKSAIASGVLQVKYAGPPERSITYQSLTDMQKALDRMLSDNARSASSGSTVSYVATRKGL